MRIRLVGSFLISLLILTACTHVSVQSNVEEYSKPCSINVTDNRPDKKMLSGSIIRSIDLTPPIETILKSKLCSNNGIFAYSAREPIFIEVNDLNFSYTDEAVFIIVASVKTRGELYTIQSIGKESYVGLPSTRIGRLLDLSLDNFLQKLAIKLQ